MSNLSPQNIINARRQAPSAQRNAAAILDVLRQILPKSGTVLEIGSGTGEHARAFAPALAPISWLPSDPDPDQRASIIAWTTDMTGPKPLPPRVIDASSADWDVRPEDNIVAITSANVIHISPWSTTQGLVAGAGRILPPGGVLHFYGPFKRGGVHITDSNAAFDATLRARDPAWGVRDLDDIEALAKDAGLELDQVIDMPSNNYSVVFKRA
jgi:SAM-dependent methyltransferase